MRTTLRFTSVVAGVAALVLLAAIILSAQDWLSTSPSVNKQVAVHTSAPTPRARPPIMQASPTTPPVAAPTPPVALAATVSTPRPTVALGHPAVVQASIGRPAVKIAQIDEKHADHLAV